MKMMLMLICSTKIYLEDLVQYWTIQKNLTTEDTPPPTKTHPQMYLRLYREGNGANVLLPTTW